MIWDIQFVLTYCLVTRTGGGPPASLISAHKTKRWSTLCVVQFIHQWHGLHFPLCSYKIIQCIMSISTVSYPRPLLKHIHIHTHLLSLQAVLCSATGLFDVFLFNPKIQFFLDQTKLFTQVWLCNDKSCHIPIQMLLFFFSLFIFCFGEAALKL